MVKAEDDADHVASAPGASGTAWTPRSTTSARRSSAGAWRVVLRYGFFYGPGHLVRVRRLPGERGAPAPLPDHRRGSGMVSFIHVDDAAGGDRRRLRPRLARHLQRRRRRAGRRCATGCPVYAEALGAKRPLRVPGGWPGSSAGAASPAARRAAGRVEREGEARARLEAALPEWREGFREALGEAVETSSTPRPRRRRT